jgi:hypothetical protein
VPTSVLLAVLTAAGLLALAPALTRRHDPPAPAPPIPSTGRLLSRRRRRRTVPGRHPVRPPRHLRAVADGAAAMATAASAPTVTAPTVTAGSAAPEASAAAGRSAARSARRPDRRSGRRGAAARRRTPARRVRWRRSPPTALHRRRRVFVALVLLNLVELAGVVLVGPGFWIGFSVAFVVLLAYLVYLRRTAVAAARRRRLERRRAAWIAAQQAAIRREHERRAAERARRIAESRRDAVRLAIPRTERYPRRTGTE